MKVKILDLSFNPIGNHGFSLLVHAIKNDRTIEELYLNSCSIILPKLTGWMPII